MPPDYEYEQTQVYLNTNGLEMQAKGNRSLSLGWKGITQLHDENEEDDSDEQVLPEFKENQIVSFELAIESKEAKHPKQITEAKLVADNGLMAKLGLGT